MTIVRLLFAVFACAIAFGGQASALTMGNAPWCAVVESSPGNIEWDCDYQTVEECVPNVLGGNRGFCNVNPYWQPPPGAPGRPGRHKRHIRYQ
jgi:hypothetical protein